MELAAFLLLLLRFYLWFDILISVCLGVDLLGFICLWRPGPGCLFSFPRVFCLFLSSLGIPLKQMLVQLTLQSSLAFFLKFFFAQLQWFPLPRLLVWWAILPHHLTRSWFSSVVFISVNCPISLALCSVCYLSIRVLSVSTLVASLSIFMTITWNFYQVNCLSVSLSSFPEVCLLSLSHFVCFCVLGGSVASPSLESSGLM